MGLFGNIFGKEQQEQEEKQSIHWIPLTELNQLDTINTSEKLTVIFKHSTRCIISKTVLREFESSFDLNAEDIDLYFLDLIQYREISNAIADKWLVVHQSPQLIVLKSGKVLAHDSHSDITKIDLKSFV